MFEFCCAEPYDFPLALLAHSDFVLVGRLCFISSQTFWLLTSRSFSPATFRAVMIFRQAVFNTEELVAVLTLERHVSFNITYLAVHSGQHLPWFVRLGYTCAFSSKKLPDIFKQVFFLSDH